MLKILLVDDHEVVRLGLKSLLSHYPKFEVVAEANNAEEAIRLANEYTPDVVVMDIRLPGKSGIEATREITGKHANTKVIMLTTFADDELLFDAISAAKARAIEIKQLVEQHRLPKILDSEDRFNFVAGKKLRFILVDAATREGLNKGSLFIVRYDGRSEVVPAAIAERIRERDERAVVKLSAESAPVDENDPYKDFVVPDDLKW